LWSYWLARYLIADSWGCPLDKKKLFLLRAFCVLCPIIGERNGMPVILPKPEKVRFNMVGKTVAPFELPVYELHANGRPAVEYWGMFNLYYWHNTKIPQRMGETNCEHWKPEWILDETNSEVRRLLIQEVGYERMVKAIGATVRNQWREYELLQLNAPNMPIRYQLLKMTCPSTGDVHVLRAPPDCETAEQAISWCNHGIHPDNFEAQA